MSSFVRTNGKIKSYLDLGKKEGAKVYGGSEAKINSGLEKETISNRQFSKVKTICEYSREIFGPVVSVTPLKMKKKH